MSREPAGDPAAPTLPGRRSIRVMLGHPRLFFCALAGVLVGIVTPWSWNSTTRGLIGWDFSVALYLILVTAKMSSADGGDLRRRARESDEGRYVILAVAIVAAIVSFGAIVAELAIGKELARNVKASHIGLAIATIVLSWFFLHFMFALHYANEYFMECDQHGDVSDIRGGLDFPGGRAPLFLDFLYFAYTIGVAAQTADVSTESREMRIFTLVHSIVSFFFNTAILALAINIAAGLI